MSTFGGGMIESVSFETGSANFNDGGGVQHALYTFTGDSSDFFLVRPLRIVMNVSDTVRLRSAGIELFASGLIYWDAPTVGTNWTNPMLNVSVMDNVALASNNLGSPSYSWTNKSSQEGWYYMKPGDSFTAQGLGLFTRSIFLLVRKFSPSSV